MDDKLNRYLGNKSLEELGTLRGLVSSICRDYDNSLVNYATMNDDRSFTKMTKDKIKELEEENKRLRKTVVMQEMEYNQLLKSYNRLAKELEEAKANRSPFTIFKK